MKWQYIKRNTILGPAYKFFKANFEKLGYFERFLKSASPFADGQLALFIDCVDLVKRFAQSDLAVLYTNPRMCFIAQKSKRKKNARKKENGQGT